MGDAVANSFSHLLPLLILLLVVFGVLILAAILLRGRLRRDTEQPSVRRSTSPLLMRGGDVGVVLGRTFQVLAVEELKLPEGASLWCCLEREDGPSRLLLRKDLSAALYYPGQGEAPAADPFPEQINRDELSFRRGSEPLALGEGWKVAAYQGPGERALAVEVKGGKATLWRGKAIPVEGVEVLQDKAGVKRSAS
jgi:hypothetical protein